MDRLSSIELFVRIVERASFSAAAADVGVSRPVATATIKELEHRLGTRLLQRTTRHVQPTVEGEIYYRRCMAILADIEDADRSASGAVTGLLRRKSTRRTPVTNAHLVCRLLLEKKNTQKKETHKKILCTITCH